MKLAEGAGDKYREFSPAIVLLPQCYISVIAHMCRVQCQLYLSKEQLRSNSSLNSPLYSFIAADCKNIFTDFIVFNLK
jgi:hypothetical protein